MPTLLTVDRPFAVRGQQTSLDMVSSKTGAGPTGVKPGIFPGSAGVDLRQTVPVDDPATNQAAASVPQPTTPVKQEGLAALASAGIPTGAKELNRLGAQQGLLSSMAEKLLDHPNVLKAIFNNKMVVDAFMNRDVSRKNCANGAALKSYLSDANSAGMQKVFPVIQAALSRPDTAVALAGTEMAKRVMSCPSIEQVSNDSGTMMSITMSNPKVLNILSDPRTAMALASSPQAASLLSGAQSKMGGR